MLKISGVPMTRGGCFDIDAERSAAFAQASGSTVMASADEVIASSDMVYICTWTSEHQSLVEKCIAAGKPFFCEKPLSIGLSEASEMHAAAIASGLTHQCGLILRRSPAYLWARELISDPAA
jgi:myo-inositol 2-dehydrogenase/D-chiro-inositol 1-dehydrogenase